jgi:predicted GIY-YIG superfamily endonuclease
MTTLYRLWNADHTLLYVGITDDLEARTEEHRADKPWWDEVAQVSTEELPTRRRALEAETRAIYWEQPRYNILGSPRYSADWEARYHALEDIEARRCALPTLSEQDFQDIAKAMTTLVEAGFRDEAGLLFDCLDKLYQRSLPLAWLESAGVKRP